MSENVQHMERGVGSWGFFLIQLFVEQYLPFCLLHICCLKRWMCNTGLRKERLFILMSCPSLQKCEGIIPALCSSLWERLVARGQG